jgi:hypothetical protein
VSQTFTSDTRQQGAVPIPGDTEIWHQLLSATTDQAFCSAWLTLLCMQLKDVTAGVVLLQVDGANNFAPVALWPAAPRDLSHLGNVAQTALVECRGAVQRTPEQPNGPWHVAYPIGESTAVLGAVALEIPPRSEAQVHELLRKLHWGLGWLQERFARRGHAAIEQKAARIGSVMEVMATALRPAPLQESLLEIINLVARELKCSRAALGLTEHSAIRVAAISDAAWFEKNTEAVKHYVAAMEEAVDQLAVVRHVTTAEVRADASVAPAHAELARSVGAHSIVSTPLLLGGKCLGVLTVEREGTEPFTSAESDWLDALAGLLPSAIDHKRRAERGFTTRLLDDLRTLFHRLFGPRHLVWKFCASCIVVVLAVLLLVEMDYRVRARTVVEGQVQRAAVAPFEGFIAESFVRAGDIVRKGQVICTLDDRELRLEKDRWSSEQEQRLRELREAMANHDLTQVQVIGAQLRQAEAQLALVNEKLARSRVTAPFDGVVISGDLSQLIGSPVEPGKKLFEIAPLKGYRMILQVDETEIRNVQVGQSGRLLISGIAVEPIPFRVSKVTPVATAEDGRNFFRVEATLARSPPNLRPGMQGVGKISTGERRLWWIVSHSFTDWLRVTLWKWMP